MSVKKLVRKEAGKIKKFLTKEEKFLVKEEKDKRGELSEVAAGQRKAMKAGRIVAWATAAGVFFSSFLPFKSAVDYFMPKKEKEKPKIELRMQLPEKKIIYLEPGAKKPAVMGSEKKENNEKEEESRAEEVTFPLKDYESSTIDEDFIGKIIQIESRGNPKARSHKGARGLMQIMPGTWKETTKKLYGKGLPFDEAYDPQRNVEVGTNYYGWIEGYIKERHPDWESLDKDQRQKLIAAAYNGGIIKLKKTKWNIEKMPKESRNYVKRLERLEVGKTTAKIHTPLKLSDLK